MAKFVAVAFGVDPMCVDVGSYALGAAALRGRTFPADVGVLSREIAAADRIIFFTAKGKLGKLTQAEMDFIQSNPAVRDKVMFVFGAID